MIKKIINTKKIKPNDDAKSAFFGKQKKWERTELVVGFRKNRK